MFSHKNSQAVELASKLANKERMGRSRVVQIEDDEGESKNPTADFWKHFGLVRPPFRIRDEFVAYETPKLSAGRFVLCYGRVAELSFVVQISHLEDAERGRQVRSAGDHRPPTGQEHAQHQPLRHLRRLLHCLRLVSKLQSS